MKRHVIILCLCASFNASSNAMQTKGLTFPANHNNQRYCIQIECLCNHLRKTIKHYCKQLNNTKRIPERIHRTRNFVDSYCNIAQILQQWGQLQKINGLTYVFFKNFARQGFNHSACRLSLYLPNQLADKPSHNIMLEKIEAYIKNGDLKPATYLCGLINPIFSSFEDWHKARSMIGYFYHIAAITNAIPSHQIDLFQKAHEDLGIGIAAALAYHRKPTPKNILLYLATKNFKYFYTQTQEQPNDITSYCVLLFKKFLRDTIDFKSRTLILASLALHYATQQNKKKTLKYLRELRKQDVNSELQLLPPLPKNAHFALDLNLLMIVTYTCLGMHEPQNFIPLLQSLFPKINNLIQRAKTIDSPLHQQILETVKNRITHLKNMYEQKKKKQKKYDMLQKEFEMFI